MIRQLNTKLLEYPGTSRGSVLAQQGIIPRVAGDQCLTAETVFAPVQLDA